MPLLLFLVRPINEGGEDLDQHVVAAEAKGCCLRRYARGGAFELVREEGALGRGGGIHRLVPALSSAGSQHVSMNTRCPFTIYGSYKVSEVP